MYHFFTTIKAANGFESMLPEFAALFVTVILVESKLTEYSYPAVVVFGRYPVEDVGRTTTETLIIFEASTPCATVAEAPWEDAVVPVNSS